MSNLLHVEAQQLSLLIMFIKPKKWCIQYVSVEKQHPILEPKNDIRRMHYQIVSLIVLILLQ